MMRAAVARNGSLLGIAIAGIVALADLPMMVDTYSLLQLTLYLVLGILSLSLGFVSGYGGILCLGQSAFFGLGAYAYAISVIDLGESTLPVLIAIALPALLAVGLGYFIFYGRITDIYVGVITLTLALILFNVVNATAGPQYHIGETAIGGFNGIPNVPPLNVPFDSDESLGPEELFYVSGGALLLTYLGLRVLLRTRFGRVVVAVRENEQRAELLGFDVRLHKLLAFAVGGALAGLAGCLYTNWGGYVSPSVFSVVQSAQVIIWVMVGGAGTLLGPVLGSTLLTWTTTELGTQQTINANLVLGAVLIVFVVLVPRGLLPLVTGGLRWVGAWLRPRLPGQRWLLPARAK